MSGKRWSVWAQPERATALMDRGVVAGVIYGPWGEPLAQRIADLLNAAEGDG